MYINEYTPAYVYIFINYVLSDKMKIYRTVLPSRDDKYVEIKKVLFKVIPQFFYYQVGIKVRFKEGIFSYNFFCNLHQWEKRERKKEMKNFSNVLLWTL